MVVEKSIVRNACIDLIKEKIMEEKEVVQYLKDNKKKGISFKFMPKEVQDWIRKNYRDCLYFNDNGKWEKAGYHLTGVGDIRANAVYALSKGYKSKSNEPESVWVEFDIDENGYYRIPDTDMRFHWSEWIKPLLRTRKDENQSWHLICFGGWQYKDCDTWCMSQKVIEDEEISRESYSEDHGSKFESAIPVKIRFWREFR